MLLFTLVEPKATLAPLVTIPTKLKFSRRTLDNFLPLFDIATITYFVCFFWGDDYNPNAAQEFLICLNKAAKYYTYRFVWLGTGSMD